MTVYYFWARVGVGGVSEATKSAPWKIFQSYFSPEMSKGSFIYRFGGITGIKGGDKFWTTPEWGANNFGLVPKGGKF